jgi:SAM-dependent methyltransferase
MGDRVVLRAGNALTEDLGTDAFDVILLAQLLQFFDDATCADLIRRAARALRPGGCLIIQDMIRPDAPKKVQQTAAFADLYYALIDETEARSFQEFARWQADAGLVPQTPFRFVTSSGLGQQSALKPI